MKDWLKVASLSLKKYNTLRGKEMTEGEFIRREIILKAIKKSEKR